jgi:hypothetical protein
MHMVPMATHGGRTGLVPADGGKNAKWETLIDVYMDPLQGCLASCGEGDRSTRAQRAGRQCK